MTQFYEFGAFQSGSASLELWATNSTLETHRVLVELEFFDLNSDWKSTHPTPSVVELAPNSSTEIIAGLDIPEPPASSTEAEDGRAVTQTYSIVAVARLRDAENEDHPILARHSDWPQPYRLLDPPDVAGSRAIDVTVSLAEGENQLSTVRLAARSRPIKGVVLSIDPVNQDEDEVWWSDNAVDLAPGDEQVILARGLKTDQVKLRYLGGCQ